MAIDSSSVGPLRWELAAETIAVKIRWIGLLVGYILVNVDLSIEHYGILNVLLSLGALFTLLDTYYSFRGQVFLGRFPLFIAVMEALFIGLLCYFHTGLESPFRFYYLLSLICCAIRYRPLLTTCTWVLHSTSYFILYLALPPDRRSPPTLLLTLVVLGWVTWASDAMAQLLKHVGARLAQINNGLCENQARLKARIDGAPGNFRRPRPTSSTRRKWPPSACSPPASPMRSAIPSPRSAPWCRSCNTAPAMLIPWIG